MRVRKAFRIVNIRKHIIQYYKKLIYANLPQEQTTPEKNSKIIILVLLFSSIYINYWFFSLITELKLYNLSTKQYTKKFTTWQYSFSVGTQALTMLQLIIC